MVTFGLHKEAEVRGLNLRYNQNHTVFDVMADNQSLGEFHIQVPGEHNVTNALGALTLALQLDIPVEKVRKPPKIDEFVL